MASEPQPQKLPLNSNSISYQVVRETWLTNKPDSFSSTAVGLATLLLSTGAVIYFWDLAGWAHLMPASGEQVFEHREYWRLWTTLFAHADLAHLLSNGFLFYILGFFLYGYFGSALFPLAAFFWGGVTNYIVLKTSDPQMGLIGASGVVYWMGGAWLVLYYFLSRQKNQVQRWLRTLGVALLIFMPSETFDPQISYRTHAIGFALGLAAGFWHYFRNRKRYHSAERRELIEDHEDELAVEEVANAGHDDISTAAKCCVEQNSRLVVQQLVVPL